jgi:hypothetical protein
MTRAFSPEWFDPLPDIPGTRKRWRHWYSTHVEGFGRVTIEEMHGEAYLVSAPPLVRIICDAGSEG